MEHDEAESLIGAYALESNKGGSALESADGHETGAPSIWQLIMRTGRFLHPGTSLPLCKFLDANNDLDMPLTVPPLWRSLGVTLWQF